MFRIQVSTIRLGFAVLAAILFTPRAAMAQIYATWQQPNAGTYAWNSASNWDTGVPGYTPGDIANFDSTITAPITVNLDDGAGNAFAPTLGYLYSSSNFLTTINPGAGGTLFFNNNGSSTQIINTGGGFTINASIINSDAGGLTITNSGSGTITLGSIDNGGYALTFTGSGNHIVTGSLLGIGLVTKNGSGTLTLSGNNLNSGGLTLNLGTLNINSATALGSGTFTIGSNSTIDNTSGGPLSNANNNAMTWNGSFTFTGSSDLNLGTGNVAMGASLTITGNASNLTVGGAIAGTSFRLTKSGNGTLTLNGANTFTGGVTLNAGTLNINSASALGTAAGTFIINGGTIDNTSAAAITTNNYPQTWNGDFTFTGTQSLNLGTGAVTLSASRNLIVNNSTLTIGGAITGSGFSITQNGTGVLTLNGSLSGLGTGGLTVNSGKIVAGANSTYSGDIVLNGGILEFTGNTFTTVAPYGGKAAVFKTIFLTNGGTIRNPSGSWNDNVPNATNIAAGAVLNFGTGGGILDVGSGGLLTLDDGSGAGTAWTNAELQGSGSLTKIGLGSLSLGNGTSNFSNFTGPIIINAGTLVLGSGTFQLGSTSAGTTIASGASINLNGNSYASLEPLTISGTGNGIGGVIYNSSGTSVTYPGPVTMAADSSLGGSSTGNITLTGVVSGAFNLFKVGTNTVNLNSPTGNAYTGNTTVSAGTLSGFTLNAFGPNPAATVTYSGGTIGLLFDGDGNAAYTNGNGTGALESLSPTTIFQNTLTASSGINVGRQGNFYSPLFATALNKTLLLSNPLNMSGTITLTITNSNQYGVNFTGAATLAGTPTFSVANATNSDITPGLLISGAVSGIGFIKAGAGTMILSNAANNFTGSISITGTVGGSGVLGATSDAALGNAANPIIINNATNTGAAAFEAFGTFSTARTFTFGSATNSLNLIDVSSGNALTITSALSGSDGFQKGDPGILILNNATSSISGTITVSGGILRVSNAGALGTSPITVAANEGTALQLDGTAGAFNLARALTLSGSTGVLNNGQLENYAGSNTESGAITLSGGATIGNSAAGTTLTLTGGITGAQALTFNGVGNINITTTAIGAVTGITKNGSGTTNLSVASTAYITALTVNGGTFDLSGTATLGVAAVATTVTSGATLLIDNTGTVVSNRFGGATTPRTLSLQTAILQYNAGTTAQTESTGALTSTWGNNEILVLPSTGTSAITFASLNGNAVNGGSTLLFQSGLTGSGAVFGSTLNQIFFTTAPTLSPATTGILPRSFVFDNTGGTPTYNFTSYNNTSGTANTLGIQAFTGYNTNNNLITAANTDTVRLTASTNFLSSRTINALASSGSLTVDSSAGITSQTLTDGGILVQSGTLTQGSNLIFGFAATQIEIGVAPGASYNVNGVISGTAQFNKSLGGTLTLNTRQYFNTGTSYGQVNGGTLVLAAGDNTLFPGQIGTTNTQAWAIATGATLDLNGTVQTVGDLRGDNSVAEFGSAGTVTSSTGAAVLSIRNINGNNFGGQITGPITFVMASTVNTERFYQNNTYTGRTAILGGTLELTDQGSLSATSAIDINYGTLNILNTSANNGRYNLPNRINDNAPITLSGGFILLAGRAQSATTESLGVVTLAQGLSNLNVTAGGTGINSSVLTLADLQRSSNDATLNLNGAGGQLGSAARLIITTYESAPNLTNNILGGWAVSGGTDFLSYVPTLGLAALNANGYAGYDATTITASLTATQNLKTTAAATILAGGANVNSFVMGGTVTFTNVTDTVNITSGGLLKSAASAMTFGSTVNEGNLTAGGASPSGTQWLYIHNNAAAANTLTINSHIVDNGASSVRLDVNTYNGGVVILAGSNTYTGGTVVNDWNGSTSRGGLTVGATGNIPAGGITLNNALLTQVAGGTIASANSVTLDASSTLTLVGNNTLTSLIFNNNGGSTAPTVTTGGILSLTGTISASAMNTLTLPVITGTLDFANAAPTFTISPIAYNGRTLTLEQPTLNIAAVIQNAGTIFVTGGGRLELSGASTFSGGVSVDGTSGLVLGASSTPTLGTVMAGPIGTGTLTLASGATLLSTAATTLANPLTISGNLNFDGLNNITLTGAATLPGSTIIRVAAPQQTVTFTGTVSSSAITKTGYGLLSLPLNFSGSVSTAAGSGLIGFADDGDGTGNNQNLTVNASVAATSSLSITIGRTGLQYAPYYPTASNKNFQIANLTYTGGLTITNNNGYGLEVTAPTAIGTADQIFNVLTATASNVTQGLTLTGLTSGSGGIVKVGAGALVLNNSGNTFGGAGKLITISSGIVAAGSDGALGNSNNGVLLNVAGTSGVGFRATGTFATSRTFTFGQVTNDIEVTAGNTLTLNTPFAGVSGTTTLVKNDNGILNLNAANSSSWTGTYTLGGALTGGVQVNAGVVLLSNAAALGSASNPIIITTTTDSAVQITGSITVPNPLTLNSTGGNTFVGGINWGGALESISGTNTWSGALQTNQDTGITADAGSTLNITGGITQNVHIGYYGGAGNINITTNPILTVYALEKLGSGTVNIQVNTAAPTTSGILVYAGTLTFSGANGLVAGTGTALTNILPGGTLTLDSTAAATTGGVSRLGGRVITFTGGNLNLIGNPTTAVTEALGAPTFARGQTTITVTDFGAGTNLTFTANGNNVNPAQSTGGTGATVLFHGTNLGTAGGPGVATISGGAGALTFNGGSTGATGTTSKAIFPWAIVDTTVTGLGTSFATADSTAGATTSTAIIRPLSAGEYSNTTSLVSGTNALVNSTSGSLTNQATVTVNSITLDNSNSITMAQFAQLTVSSGGILARNNSNSSVIGGIMVAPAGNSGWIFQIVGSASVNRTTVNITSNMSGGNSTTAIGLVKAGGGILNLNTTLSTIPGLTGYSSNTLLMQTVINQGTLMLSGGTNTLGANNYLEVGAGGTLDLNGTAQYVQGLYTDGTFNGIPNTVTAGGTIINSSLTSAGILVTDSDTRNWAGSITGNIFYNRTGTATTTTIYTPQTYTNGTLINGGTVSLRDYATLANTSGIELDYATLQLDNTQASDLSGRLGTAPITMRGGIFIYLGRAQTASSETIGSITIAEGFNVIDVQAGGTGINSAVLTAASLIRPAGAASTVYFNRASGTTDENGQIGSTARLLFATPPALSNNIIGPWAIAGREWASYISSYGVGALNANGFAGYATTTLATAAATDNVRITATPAVLAANATVNTLNLDYTATATIDLGTKTLTLAGGGLIFGTGTNTTTGTITDGTLTSGAANVGGDLYFHMLPYGGTNRYAVLGAVVADNGTGPVRLVISNSDIALSSISPVTGNGNFTNNLVSITGVNTYSGGTVLNQGNTVVTSTGVIPAGGITLNSATLSTVFATAGQNSPGTINSANIITLNGPSTFTTTGAVSIAGLVFNNTGATAAGAAATSTTNAPTVNTYAPGLGVDGKGTLTIGTGGIIATADNVATTSLVAGRIDLGTGGTLNITVSPTLVNGVDVASLQATLALQGIIDSGTINKSGTGVLQFNGQETFAGTVNLTAGGINIGTLGNTGLAGGNDAGSRFASYVLAAGTRFNLNNADATIGSLAGSGTVFNATNGLAVVRTLNVGFDNTSTTFSGSFARFSDVLLATIQVNKIGSGTLTLTGNTNGDTSNLQVSQGGLTYSGAGTGVFGTTIVLPTATLTLDNSGTNVNNRLGGTVQLGTANTATVLAVDGGTFKIIGNGTAATSETVGSFGFASGGLTNPNGAGVVMLVANAAEPLTFTVGTTFTGITQGSTGLLQGVSATAGNGLANFALGSVALGAPTGSGTGANGTTTMPIRPDLLGDASTSGTGTGFITKDSVTGFLRPLTAAELATPLILTGATSITTNYGLSTANVIMSNTSVGSLTLNTGTTLGLHPSITTQIDGLPVQITNNSGGVLDFASVANFGGGRYTDNNNIPFMFHVQGNLSVSAVLFGNSGGLTKDGSGTLTLNAANLYLSQTNVLAGTLVLNGGNNTLVVSETATVPTLQALGINGGTVDLNGNNQAVGSFFNNTNARYPGNAGVLTNSSATPVTFTTVPGTAYNTAISIQGNLNFNKAGGTALTLTNVSTFTGTATIRGTALNLIDSGAFTNVTAVNINYGATLNIDQSGLNPSGNLNPVRIPATAPVSLSGGTLTLTSGGSVDSTQTINTVNLVAGANIINVPQAPVGGYGALTIGNLVQTNPDATVILSGGNNSYFGGAPGLNNSNLFINQVNGTAIPATITGKILGGWAIVGPATNAGGEFATYLSAGTTGSNGVAWGVSAMNGSTGTLGTFTQDIYDATALTAAGTATTNVRLAASSTLISGGSTYCAVAVRAAATITFTNNTDVLTIASGGFSLTGNAAQVVGSAVGNGFVTAGTAAGTNRLYVYNYGAVTFNSAIIDNPAVTGAITRLVITPMSGVITFNGVNTYSGGTVVNGASGTITLASASSAIPAGGFTINNAAVTQTIVGNIAAANDLTINGGGSLTFANGANTINSITFGNIGGIATPTVATGTTSLTVATNITSVNDNMATVPTISGTALIFASATPTITTSTTVNVPVNLAITAPITSSGGVITKAGTGSLTLSGASTFGTGVNVASGALVLGASSTPTTGTVTSGPVGTGTLNLASGTSLLSDGTLRTIANAVTLTGSITFGESSGNSFAAAIAGNGVILNGPITFNDASNHTFNVNSFQNITTFGGAISGIGSSITKTGPGTLVLSLANNYDGSTTISGGVLSATVAGSLGISTAAGSILFGGGILQQGGTNTTDYSSRFGNAANQPFYIDTVAQTITYATGLSSSGGSIGKFGTGTLILPAAANTTGIIWVSAGTLQFGTGNTSTGTLPATYGDALVAGTFYVNRLSTDTVMTTSITGSGNLTIDQGTVASTGAVTLNGNLLFGSVAGTTPVITVGTLNLTSANTLSVIGGNLTAQTNTSANTALTDSVVIGTGKTLQVNGNFTVGFNSGAAANSTNIYRSVLTLSGGGSLLLTGAAAIVNVGVAETNQLTNGSVNILNVTGLSSASFGTVAAPIATFNVGFGQSNNGSVLLATGTGSANIIDATTISVGHSNGANGYAIAGGNTLTLGTGTNVLNANTINIGLSKVAGTITFASQTAGSAGTVTIANTAGTGPVTTLTVGSNNLTATGAIINAALLDLRGHATTANVATLIIGLANATSTGSAYGSVRFDTGTFNVATLNLGTRTGTTSTDITTASNLLEIGGTGIFSVSGVTTISLNNDTIATAVTPVVSNLNVIGGTFNAATINAAVKSGVGTGTATANINVSGGAFYLSGLGGTANTSFILASQTGTGTGAATGLLNLTGGVTTLAANIVDGGGNANTTVTLNGGTLNMSGNSIGIATGLIDVLNFQAGTLSNVSEINAGANLVKTTTGTLNLTGSSNYTGQTLVQNGTVTFTTIGVVGAANTSVGAPQTIAAGTIGLGSGTTTGTLSFVGTTNQATDRVIDFSGTTGGAGLDASGTGATITFNAPAFTASGSGAKTLTLSGTNTGANTINSVIPDAAGGLSIVKTGPGTWILTAANTYTGTTTINGGVLAINGNQSNALGATTVNATGTLLGTGTLGSSVSVATGGTIRAGSIGTIGTMTLKGGLTVASGGTFALQITNAATPAAAGTGGSTDLGNLPNTMNNNFYNFLGGNTVSIDPASLITVDTTLVGSFTPLASYSYQVASGAGNQSALNVPDSQFSFVGGVGEVPGSASLTGDSLGDIFLNFTAAAVPEPTALLGLAALSFGLSLLRRRNAKS